MFDFGFKYFNILIDIYYMLLNGVECMQEILYFINNLFL